MTNQQDEQTAFVKWAKSKFPGWERIKDTAYAGDLRIAWDAAIEEAAKVVRGTFPDAGGDIADTVAGECAEAIEKLGTQCN